MKIDVVCFTSHGHMTASDIEQALSQEQVELVYAGSHPLANVDMRSSKTERCMQVVLSDWIARRFSEVDALIFIGATGIAVRTIAPYIKSKMTDPAVLVVDEQGRFCIPLLSGHIGGANALAQRLADAIGGQAIVTTATDGRDLFAIDSWAVAQDLHIENPQRIKRISAALLAGDTVRLFSENPIVGALPKGIVLGTAEDCDIYIGIQISPTSSALVLVPKILSIGVGCRKGIGETALSRHLDRLLKAHGLSVSAVARLCSIDLKKQEPGLVALCNGLGLPLICYCADRLRAVQGSFSASSFVLETTGVDNVCERSAVLGSHGGRLLVGKQAYEGITMAIAVENWSARFDSIFTGIVDTSETTIANDAPVIINETKDSTNHVKGERQ